MNLSRTRRSLLFVFVCLPIRLLIPLGMIYVHKSYLRFISFILFGFSLGFMNAYMKGDKLYVGFFGGEKWWIKNDIVHAVLYLTAGVLAFRYNKKAYIPLVLDVAFSFVTFVFNNLARI